MDASHVSSARVGARQAARNQAARATLAGLLQLPQLPKARLRGAPIWLGIALLVLALAVALSIKLNLSHALLLIVLGGAAGLLVRGRLRAKAARQELQQTEFHLPLVMEEVVMGVQAGLDIVPALERVLRNAQRNTEPLSPVLKVLQEILDQCEHGQSFAAALDSARKRQKSASFSHALLHLSVAHSDGGNLVDVLRELAEATQRNFEESMEEMLATMPARAVLPLMLTFAGLMIFFLAVPLVQVLESLRKAMPQ